MNLEKIITQAWEKQAKWLYLFIPLTWLYASIIYLRKLLFKINFIKSYRSPVPVMIIGNITVGGSGKTPLIISLVKWLQKNNIKVGVISRGYGGDSSKMPLLVTESSLPHIVGDEPCLITQSTLFNGSGVPMSVCPDRQQAIELLLSNHPELQLIISDDGLQHYKLQRDIEWVVVDSSRGFGNRQLLPVGFLREPLSRLKSTKTIYNLTNVSQENLGNAEQLSMQFIADKPVPLNRLLNQNPIYQKDLKSTGFTRPEANQNVEVYAVSGIGYPQRFFTTLENLGYIVEPCPYPDHYDFDIVDLVHISQASKHKTVIITSKDAVKIKHVFDNYYADKKNNKNHIDASAETLENLLNRLFVLPISAELSPACINQLQDYIAKYFKQTN